MILIVVVMLDTILMSMANGNDIDDSDHAGDTKNGVATITIGSGCMHEIHRVYLPHQIPSTCE